MARKGKALGQNERLKAFSQRLNRAMLAKGITSAAELAREASKHVPKTHKGSDGKHYQLGRHLVTAYINMKNEPTGANLSYISQALGVNPEDLLSPLPGEGVSPQYATATSALDGTTRLVVDAEVDAEVALKVLQMVRGSVSKRGAA